MADFIEIKKRLQAEGLTADALDDLVHDEASRMASAINNGGIEDQVQFLIDERGYRDAEDIIKALE